MGIARFDAEATQALAHTHAREAGLITGKRGVFVIFAMHGATDFVQPVTGRTRSARK